jgi:hypothetical protein
MRAQAKTQADAGLPNRSLIDPNAWMSSSPLSNEPSGSIEDIRIMVNPLYYLAPQPHFNDTA